MNERLRSLGRRSVLRTAVGRRFYHALRDYKRWTLVKKLRRERTAPIQAYLRTHVVRKLQIGAGENVLPGWLNSDIRPLNSNVLFLDAKEPLPFEDCTFDYIFSEHFIEHISYAEGQSALRECYRVLKCGGRVRIATPNLNNIVALTTAAKGGAKEEYIRWSNAQFGPQPGSSLAGFVVNNFFRLWGHEFIYDPDTMELALRTTGFSGFRWFAVGESEDDDLRGIESHGRWIGEEMNRLETMVVEATRPQPDRLLSTSGPPQVGLSPSHDRG